jgi:transcriptional regulator with XRE-family HTH domain
VIVRKEEDFLRERAEIIKANLKELGIKQKQLCEILNHKSHTYISDLVRGRHPMSLNDMVILSKVLKIYLSQLIPKTISYPELKRLSDSIKKLNHPKLSGELLELATA